VAKRHLAVAEFRARVRRAQAKAKAVAVPLRALQVRLPLAARQQAMQELVELVGAARLRLGPQVPRQWVAQ
jgi:hypothetical protein